MSRANIINFPITSTSHRLRRAAPSRVSAVDDGAVRGPNRLTHMIITGDALDVLPRLTAITGRLVNCVVTSPPYYRQRTYGDSTAEVGTEETTDEYVSKLADVFDAVPLHPKGSVWVNLGDKREDGQLLLVPHRFALEMKRRGWLLPDEIIWAKDAVDPDGTTHGNQMPDPARNRINGNGHEFLFRFVRNKDAWCDLCAVSIPRQEGNGQSANPYLPPELMATATSVEGRNPPNVWHYPPGKIHAEHYAVYSDGLCERPIAMTCPMWVDRKGDPRSRNVEMQEYDEGRKRLCLMGKYTNDNGMSGRNDTGRPYVPRKPVTLGWTTLDHAWQPGTVLDPFCGTGTTGVVALRMGRSFIGIDLYPVNVAIAGKQCREELTRLKSGGLPDPFQVAA